MKPIVSPKELAQAIGVSESSIKRWVDEGVIRAEKTSGGHRRIPIREVIRYTRDNQTRIVRPDVLGIPEEAATVDAALTDAQAIERLHRHLMEGDTIRARGLVLSLYLMGRSVAEICDLPIHESMKRIGALFQEDEAGVFFEHRATEICIESLNRLRTMIDSRPEAPVAVGAALSGDAHSLPTLAAATVLGLEGFEAVNLGADLPAASFLKAVEVYRPSFAWLSLSWAQEREAAHAAISSLGAELSARGVPLVVGGVALGAHGLRFDPPVLALKSMRDLVEFAGRYLTQPGA